MLTRLVCADPSPWEREMMKDGKIETRVGEAMPRTVRLEKPAAGRLRLLSWVFAREAASQNDRNVETRVHFDASPEAVWNHLMFYEEVPGRAPLLLRALFPHPVRTEGDKTRVGAAVRCEYSGGELIKRITAVEPPHFLGFEVIEQRLGIEGCIIALGGSYQISTQDGSADVMLSTNYRAYLHPRFLWRPLESLLLGQLHRHILRGISGGMHPENPAFHPVAAKSSASPCAPPGGLACTASRSFSRQ